MTQLYGGYTYSRLLTLVAQAQLTETSIDDMCGGDSAASGKIIYDLLIRVRDLTILANQLERSCDKARSEK